LKLKRKALQIFPERATQIVTAQGEFNGGLKKPELVAGIVAGTFEPVRINGTRAQQMAQRIRQLDFRSGTRFDRLQRLKYLRDQHVAADDRQVGRRLRWFGLFHEVPNAEYAVPVAVVGDRLGVDRAISRDVLRGNLHHGHHRRAEELVDVQQLAQAGRFGVDHIVGQDYRERLIPHQLHGAQNGVSQPQGFLLPSVRNVDHVGDVAHDRKQILLAPRFKHVFQLEADVKMIFDGALAAAGDDNDVLNSGMQRLLDAILNERFIDQRQHLHRLRLGGGQEAAAKPPGREYGFANLGSHYPQYAFGRPVLATNRRIIPQSVQPSRRSRPRQNRGTLPRARPCTSHPRVR